MCFTTPAYHHPLGMEEEWNCNMKIWDTNVKNMPDPTELCYKLVTSLLTRAIQTGESSRIGWPIGAVKHVTWGIPYISYTCCCFSHRRILTILHPTGSSFRNVVFCLNNRLWAKSRSSRISSVIE
jgi:hypothetical protein